AEAEAIDARARALEVQSQAVLAQELIHLLPEIAAEYAQAIGAIDTMTVVSADGTSKVAGDAMGNIKGLLDMARDTVGIDLVGMLNSAVSGTAAGAAAGRAARGEQAGHQDSASELVQRARQSAAETLRATDDAARANDDESGNEN